MYVLTDSWFGAQLLLRYTKLSTCRARGELLMGVLTREVTNLPSQIQSLICLDRKNDFEPFHEVNSHTTISLFLEILQKLFSRSLIWSHRFFLLDAQPTVFLLIISIGSLPIEQKRKELFKHKNHDLSSVNEESIRGECDRETKFCRNFNKRENLEVVFLVQLCPF